MDKNILVSVIIPTYRDWLRLNSCIDSLLKQSLERRNYEIIIVNNDPMTKPEHHLKDLGLNIKLISEDKPGSYAARNAGLSIAKGEILAFTDSDCIVDEYWLENGVALFQDREELDLIGGRIDVVTTYEQTLYENYDQLFAFKQIDYVKRGFSVTANLLVRKRVFDSIGFFDANIKSSGDRYFCLRARNHGFKLDYLHTAVVYHPARKSFQDLISKTKRVAGGVDKDKIYIVKILKAMFYLRPPLKEFSIVLRSKYNFSSKIKLALLTYCLRVVSVFERFKVAHGVESKR